MFVKLYIVYRSIKKGDVHLNRSEAVALLKELIRLHLVQPSLISIEKNASGTFSLILKANGNIQGVRQFITEKNLVIEEDEKNGYCIIFEA